MGFHCAVRLKRVVHKAASIESLCLFLSRPLFPPHFQITLPPHTPTPQTTHPPALSPSFLPSRCRVTTTVDSRQFLCMPPRHNLEKMGTRYHRMEREGKKKRKWDLPVVSAPTQKKNGAKEIFIAFIFLKGSTVAPR